MTADEARKRLALGEHLSIAEFSPEVRTELGLPQINEVLENIGTRVDEPIVWSEEDVARLDAALVKLFNKSVAK